MSVGTLTCNTMRDEIDLDAAAAAGLIGEDQVTRLRNFEALGIGLPLASQEKFALFSGLADIFGAIGLIVLTAGLYLPLIRNPSVIGTEIAVPAIFVVLATIPTLLLSIKIRRQTATMGILLIVSAFSAYALASVALRLSFGFGPNETPQWLAASAVLIAIFFVGWFGYIPRYPPAPALAALALIFFGNVLAGPFDSGQHPTEHIFSNLLTAAAGAILLLIAIWIDLKDVRRETVRSQIAFWFHSASGFVIVNATFGYLTGMSWVN